MNSVAPFHWTGGTVAADDSCRFSPFPPELNMAPTTPFAPVPAPVSHAVERARSAGCWRVAADAALSLYPVEPMRIAVLAGTVWLTWDEAGAADRGTPDGSGDRVLHAGEGGNGPCGPTRRDRAARRHAAGRLRLVAGAGAGIAVTLCIAGRCAACRPAYGNGRRGAGAWRPGPRPGRLCASACRGAGCRLRPAARGVPGYAPSSSAGSSAMKWATA